MAESPPEQSSAVAPERSEFGRGIVVCLAKFSEHLHEHGTFSERTIREFARWTPKEKARCQQEAAGYPHGDSAAKLRRMRVAEVMGDGDSAAALSSMIEMWMNGASDHFYDLDPAAPAPLRELADLTLRIGHGFTGERWTIETADRIRSLWQEACLEVDRRLGVDPDWGEF
jgi:hypothetical protein